MIRMMWNILCYEQLREQLHSHFFPLMEKMEIYPLHAIMILQACKLNYE